MAKKAAKKSVSSILKEIYDPDVEVSSNEAIDLLQAKTELEEQLGLFMSPEELASSPMCLEPFGCDNFFGVKISEADGKAVLEVLVRKKASDSSILGGTQLPDSFNGVTVKVVEIPDEAEFQAVSAGGKILSKLITPSSREAGTLGAIVRIQGAGSKRFILTNQHVIAGVNPRDDDEVVEDTNPRRKIARLSLWTKMLRQGNRVDGAVARITASSGVTAADGNFQIKGAPMSLNEVQSRARSGQFFVKKRGQKSGETFGLVANSRQGTVNVAGRQFVDQITILGTSGIFSDSGDSGSLVISHPDNRPVGLLFAGRGDRSYINPIFSVVNVFKITDFVK